MRPVCSRRAAYELDEQDFLDYLDCLDDPGILFAVIFLPIGRRMAELVLGGY